VRAPVSAMPMNQVTIHEAILSSMSDAVYVVDRELRIQYANPAAERMTGYSADESIGKLCVEIFCERSHLCEDACPLKKAIREEASYLHRDAETRTKSGIVRRTQVSISPFFDGGRSAGVVVVINDISELKAAEEQIRRQNSFLSTVIDALPHPFYVIDADTYRLKLANYAAFPGTLPELLTCHELSHKRDSPCGGEDHPCPLQRVRDTGQPVTVEHVHAYADGSTREVEVHGYPLFDEKGRLTQIIEYCIDISERKRAAREREQLIDDLQRALSEVKTLSGLLPICSACKKIRDDKGYWNNLEQYISSRSDAVFSHGLCPDCAQKLFPAIFKKTDP
jgi:PAS domain S-box-containing protein